MATPVIIPVSEYLKTSYKPDRDYVDGQLKERPLGETPHATTQSVLSAIFLANRKIWKVRAVTEQRIQTSETHFRVADVCVWPFGNPPGGIIRNAPLICVEILSPEQSLSDIWGPIHDYLLMGVENVWILDPVRRQAWYADLNGYHELLTDEFSVPGTDIRIQLAEIYEQLDEMAAGR
jgi:Uma2 family endonuclease